MHFRTLGLTIWIHLFILTAVFQSSFAQVPASWQKTFAEAENDQQRFEMYLDSIDKFLYRDIDIAEAAMQACQAILDRGGTLPDSSQFKFVLQSIYLRHSMADPLGAYTIIATHQNRLDTLNISVHDKSVFQYLAGFTYMELGDLKTAQETYYQTLENAYLDQDTSTVISCYHSLGQLFNDDKDPREAIRHLQKVLTLGYPKYQRPSTLVLTYIELCEAYEELNQNDSVLLQLNTAYEIAEENNLQILTSDVLILKGQLLLENNELKAARKIFSQLSGLQKGSQDPNIINNTKEFRVDLLKKEGKYVQALSILKELRKGVLKDDLDLLISYDEKAEGICEAMKDYQTAHQYLSSFIELKKQRDEDERKQKTAYLKIKFETEEKEKENAILTAKVIRNQTERQLLYLGMALSVLVLAVVVGAFYQKKRYSKRLEADVLSRTLHLQKANELLNESNRDLKEFNRILSHDLKEPLRSIVGFSQLAERATTDNPKVQDYLGLVISSGIQLEQLIDSINTFQKATAIDLSQLSPVNLPGMLDDIVASIQPNFPDRSINLRCEEISAFHASEPTLSVVFSILIDNAVRYNEHRTASISVRYQRKTDKHLIEIEDNGIGIKPDYHHHVFEMFTRLNKREKYEGAGMGLSIARKLMERMGGTLSILRSIEKDGSTFLLVLPLSKA
ncbi:MAG: ATP-binding protein [Bacteroidota bacterium]